MCISCLLALVFWTYSQWHHNSSGGAMRSCERLVNQHRLWKFPLSVSPMNTAIKLVALTQTSSFSSALSVLCLWKWKMKSTHSYVFSVWGSLMYCRYTVTHTQKCIQSYTHTHTSVSWQSHLSTTNLQQNLCLDYVHRYVGLWQPAELQFADKLCLRTMSTSLFGCLRLSTSHFLWSSLFGHESSCYATELCWRS